jgi:hypothetical protein
MGFMKKKKIFIIKNKIMNRSFSKIRHIQEVNALLDKRVIKEQNTDNAGALVPVEDNPSVQPQNPNAIEPTEVKNNKIPLCSTKLPAGFDVNADNVSPIHKV